MPGHKLVWLITGTTSGIGRELALAALKRGEIVIATGRSRSIDKLDDLRSNGADVLELDVTSPLETLHEVAKKAVALHGRIDVVVNNAGYVHFGTIEEVSPQETLDQFNTNFFGAINVTRAFLPYMRERKSGTIVFVGSIGGWIGGPYGGLYGSTKWALRGLSASLQEEISHFGLRSTCIDFGFFRTSVLEDGQRAPKVRRIEDYKTLVDSRENPVEGVKGKQPGNPIKGAHAVIDLVKGEGMAAGKPFPTSLCLGTDGYHAATGASQAALIRLNEWKELSSSTDY